MVRRYFYLGVCLRGVCWDICCVCVEMVSLFVFVIAYTIMSERVEKNNAGDVMMEDFCQVDAASTVALLLPVVLSDDASGVNVLGSTVDVDSLSLSGLRVSGGALEDPVVGEVSVSVGVSSITKVSDSMGVGIGVSNVTGCGVGSSGLSVTAVSGESGCLVLLGEIDAGPTRRE